MSADRHQRSVEITKVSDTLENTNRETKRETKHTHTHCLGHRGGLAAATVQVRSSELQERVAPSAAPSAHRARRGMGGGYARKVSAATHCPPLRHGGRRCARKYQPRICSHVENYRGGGFVVGFVSTRGSRRTSGDVEHLYPHQERDAPTRGALIPAATKSTNKLQQAQIMNKHTTPKRTGKHKYNKQSVR